MGTSRGGLGGWVESRQSTRHGQITDVDLMSMSIIHMTWWVGAGRVRANVRGRPAVVR